MITWTVGSGGLLGSAVTRASEERFGCGPIPWADPEAAAAMLRAEARRFGTEVGDDPWAVVWAAGAATTSTSADVALSELEPLRALLEGIRSALPRGPGSVFVTSSAGGVYAGSTHPPFTASSEPAPLSPYGELKLAQEHLASETLGAVCPVVIGRVSNLYGPGQNLTKLQGLISRLALAAVTRQPINIFVPLDTIRDYIYVDDAARAVLDAAAWAAQRGTPGSTTLVIASGQPATVGQVLRTMNLVAKRRVPVALGSHPSASAQSADLRLEPTHALDAVTSLPAGMKAVYLDILERVQRRSVAG
jgi:UDP-glucose 4-epimerase